MRGNKARMFRRKYIRYKEAEWIYSIQHKKLLELADKAVALFSELAKSDDETDLFLI